MKIMLSGANGFIGRTLVPYLVEKGVDLTLLCRVGSAQMYSNVEVVYVDSFNSEDLYSVDMSCIDVFIHLAAIAHVSGVNSVDRLDALRCINTDSTIALANIAAVSRVKRFIFLSTVGVYGSETSSPVKATDPVNPVDDYSKSKLEAEIGIKHISEEKGLDVVIIRPPLVYGSNAPGKFGSLVNLVLKKFPLPFGAIHNKRSLVSVHNLVDFISLCIEHEGATNQTFLVSDDRDISTTELIRYLRQSAFMQPLLVPVPLMFLYLVTKFFGQEQMVRRMCSNFQVDIKHTKEVLGWKPPLSIEEGIKRCFKNDNL